MHDDPGLVVRGAASVEATVLLERLEGPGVPFLGGSRGLHIVMGVEKDRGSPGWAGNLPEDRRVGAGVLEQLDVLDSRPPRAARRCARRTAEPAPVDSWER